MTNFNVQDYLHIPTIIYKADKDSYKYALYVNLVANDTKMFNFQHVIFKNEYIFWFNEIILY
jgi:hypothetical protein